MSQPKRVEPTPAQPKRAATKPPPKKIVNAKPPEQRALAVVPKVPVSLLAVIADAVIDPRCDVQKMRALLDMQKEVVAEEARMAFTRDFIEMSTELPIINAKGRIVIEGKPGKKSQSTPYATYNEIVRVTKPILARHGFALWSAPDEGQEGRIIMRVHLDHVKGHGKMCAIPLPLETSGSKNNVQGVGSSISYGKRFGAVALLNLISEAQEDRDLDGHDPKAVDKDEGPATISTEQITALGKAIMDCGVGLDRFCAKYKIETVSELPAAMFDAAMSACRNYKPKASDGKASE